MKRAVTAPYAALSPNCVLEALESVGFRPDGRSLALASYENRVYQIGIDAGEFVVVKFYRPQRWSDAAILEEHAFACELAAAEIPVVAPLEVAGATLHRHAGYRFAVFPRRGGRWPELGTSEDRKWLGRFIGRIHAVGATRSFAHRPTLTIEAYGDASVRDLLAHDWIPPHLVANYRSVTSQLLDAVRECFDAAGAYVQLRIHGDCHSGNVLWTDAGPHFVDLDDCMRGPAVQDLWLFLSGSPEDIARELGDVLEGYEQFAPFDYRQLRLIEALRSLRMLHYAAWLARRWDDPAFPRAFPWFAEPRYWEEHVLALKEQIGVLGGPPLELRI
jgi:Ser/Thr protein kinase RdoA (MazF antagonist)